MERMSTSEPPRLRDYISERETDVLGGLLDYHKMNLADVDVIERTVNKCRPKIPTKGYKPPDDGAAANELSEQCDQESDELTIQNFGMIEEEIIPDEQAPEVAIMMGLDMLLKRIQILQCDIRLHQQLEGVESQAEDQAAAAMLQKEENMEKCLEFPRHLAEMRQLQRAQHQLQCQITELLCRYDHLRTQKRTLFHQWNLVLQKTEEIRELASDYYQWMKDTSPELNICRKRSRAIRAGKLTKQLAIEVTETNIYSSIRYSQRYLLRKLVRRHVNDLHCEIKELLQFSKDLTVEVDKRLDVIKQKASKIGRLARPWCQSDVEAARKEHSALRRSSKYKTDRISIQSIKIEQKPNDRTIKKH